MFVTCTRFSIKKKIIYKVKGDEMDVYNLLLDAVSQTPERVSAATSRLKELEDAPGFHYTLLVFTDFASLRACPCSMVWIDTLC